MTTRLFKILTIVGVISLLIGCKLAVIVPSGGDVTSSSGTRNCAGGNLCEHNITDSTFYELLTAVAKPGYVFTKWSAGPGFLCANSVDPTCVVTNTGLPEGNAGIEGILAGGSFFYAMPIFDFVGVDSDGDDIKDHLDHDDDNDGVLDEVDTCPLDPEDTCGISIDRDGRKWLDPAQFAGVTWAQVNALCPAPSGTCLPGAKLNGVNLQGWTWASVDEMNDLFNDYIRVNELGPGPDNFSAAYQSSWGAEFTADGWTPTIELGNWRITEGLTRSDFLFVGGDDSTVTVGYVAALRDANSAAATDWAITDWEQDKNQIDSGVGAWFMRAAY